MGAFLRRVRKWRAVAWEPTGESDSGERVYGAPFEVKCRWEDYEGEEVDANNKTFRAKGRVFVDRALPIGSIIKRPLPGANQRAGTALAALTGATGSSNTEATVFEQPNTHKVRKTETIPLLKPSADEHWTVVLSGRND